LVEQFNTSVFDCFSVLRSFMPFPLYTNTQKAASVDWTILILSIYLGA